MIAEIINEILGITESYKMPDVLMEKLLGDGREEMFDDFMGVGESLDHDWFTEYYQTEHGDRDKLKQDFTPDSVCQIATELLSNHGTIADICTGTGGLTLKEWQRGTKDFFCIEFASRAIPVLLFNLAIRNVSATVYNGDALSREVFKCYELKSGERYSSISLVERNMDFTADNVIMNPPYSLKWDWTDEQAGEPRFVEYGLPPKSKSDYAFILDGLSRLPDGGSLVAILPHGVLFRGSKEGDIRRKLIENNLLDTVIGLPDKLFLNTQIPVCVLKLTKGRRTTDVLFVDASKEFRKDGKLSVMDEKHIDTLLSAVHLRRDVDKLAHVATLDEIEKNDYNLNIPRYVDISEPPEPIDGIGTMSELLSIQKEIRQTQSELTGMLDDMTGTEEFEKMREIWKEFCNV